MRTVTIVAIICVEYLVPCMPLKQHLADYVLLREETESFEEQHLMSLHTRESAPTGECPAAPICPFKTICFLYADESTNPLHPRIHHAEKGEVQVVNPGADQLVYVFRSGFFMICGEAEPGLEVPFAIYGEGVVAGAVELYATTKVSDTYNIYTLLPGDVCVLHSNEIRAKLETLPYEYAQRIVSSGLMNQFTSVFALMRIRGRTYIYDQIVALLNYFMEFSPSNGEEQLVLEITQEEIASIVNANRMAVSRVLKKMQEDGLIEHSYKSIAVNRDALPKASYSLSGALISPEDDVDLYKAYMTGWKTSPEK